MRRMALLSCVSVLVLGLCVGQATSARTDRSSLEVQVSPQTLLLGSDQGSWVTVHATIAYRDVDVASVALNGVPVAWAKADSRGELVAEFDEGAIKSIVEPPSATLVLTGNTKDGEFFSGSDTVRVVDWSSPW